MSHFQALYGYEPPQLGSTSIPKGPVEAVNTYLRDRQEALHQLKANLVKAQARSKQFADKNRSERKFKEGDWVYLKLQPYRQLSVSGVKNQKLGARYYGPYEVLQRIGMMVYRLNLPVGLLIHPIFHVSQLKARVSDTHAVSPSLPLVSPGGSLQPKPSTILACRMVKKRNMAETQLLIKWYNQPDEEATWEDYKEIEPRFPEFLLKVEKGLKKGGVSGAEGELGVINFEPVNILEEEGQLGKKGQETGSDPIKDEKLTLGPNWISLCEEGPIEVE
ncbi:uncharacterized protein LOC144567682 [Carex rostrata]